jgi:hypothetical protein
VNNETSMAISTDIDYDAPVIARHEISIKAVLDTVWLAGDGVRVTTNGSFAGDPVNADARGTACVRGAALPSAAALDRTEA